MSWMLAAGAIAGALGLLLIALLTIRLLAYRASAPVCAGEVELERIPFRRYAPAMRLLSREDLDFLAQQPGYRASIGRKLRKTRRRIFRKYIRELAADFHRIHASARRIAAESPDPNSDLVAKLMRQQMQFWWAMLRLELRMFAPGLGKIDMTALLTAIDEIRIDALRATPRAA